MYNFKLGNLNNIKRNKELKYNITSKFLVKFNSEIPTSHYQIEIICLSILVLAKLFHIWVFYRSCTYYEIYNCRFCKRVGQVLINNVFILLFVKLSCLHIHHMKILRHLSTVCSLIIPTIVDITKGNRITLDKLLKIPNISVSGSKLRDI